jgi:hypothetical protein
MVPSSFPGSEAVLGMVRSGISPPDIPDNQIARLKKVQASSITPFAG